MRTSYLYQNGAGSMPMFRGGVMQKGYGLGGVFKGLIRSVAPKLKQSLKTVGKKALKTGFEVLQDTARGENIKSSLKRRARENINELIQSAIPIKTLKTSKSIKSKSLSKGKGRTKAKQKDNFIF